MNCQPYFEPLLAQPAPEVFVPVPGSARSRSVTPPPPTVGYKGTGPNFETIAAAIIAKGRYDLRSVNGMFFRLLRDAVKNNSAKITLLSPYHNRGGRDYFSVSIGFSDFWMTAHIYGYFRDTFYIATDIDVAYQKQTINIQMYVPPQYA